MTATEPGQLQGMRSERNAMPSRGARFFRDDDGTVSFVFVIDAGNIIGPRPANKADSEKHADEWAEFVAADQAAQPEPETVEVVPDAIERDERPAVSHVEAKDMGPFVERIEPAPEKTKRKYTRKAA